jgi:hypothetical protein
VIFLCTGSVLRHRGYRECNHPVGLQTGAFGRDYNLLISDGPLAHLLSRAVIVADPDGRILYTEQVPKSLMSRIRKGGESFRPVSYRPDRSRANSQYKMKKKLSKLVTSHHWFSGHGFNAAIQT